MNSSTIAREPGLVRAAERINGWRADGSLPETARGLNMSPDFGNYCAWFAPREKVFVNGRYNFHLRELPDYVAVRRGLGLIDTKDEKPRSEE